MKNQLLIFSYHAVISTPLEVWDWCFLSETAFIRQLKYIHHHFEIVPLSVGAQRLKGDTKYPPMAAITFDDVFRTLAEQMSAKHTW